MLEHKSLLLLPWSTVVASPSDSGGPEGLRQRREIIDAASGSRLGQARRNVMESRGLLSWVLTAAMTVAVHETEDDSLLFTMHGRRRWKFWSRHKSDERAWTLEQSTWQVRDADEHPVGSVQTDRDGTYLPPLRAASNSAAKVLVAYDRFRSPFILSTGASPVESKFWGLQTFSNPEWTEMGRLSCVGDNVVLDFATLLEGQPFSKMLLLAEALLADFTHGMTR
jgi:hypothetical protein